MGIFVAIIFYIVELSLLFLLASKIRRYKTLTIKDTVAYPLLLVATFLLMVFTRLIYLSDMNFWDITKDSFSDAFDIIKLSFNKDMLALLKEKDIAILIAYYGAYLVSFVALTSLTIYLIFIAIKNFSRLLKVVANGKKIVLIFGFNDDAKQMIKNFKDNKVKMIVVLDCSTLDKRVDEKTFIDQFKISFVECPYKLKSDYIKTIIKLTRYKSREYTILTFFEDDKKNDEFSSEAIRFLNDEKFNSDNTRFIMCVNNVQDKYITNKIYDPVTNLDITKGKLRTFNKYNLNSLLVMRDYDFAGLIRNLENDNLRFINDDCTIENADIHAYFLGFGKVNQALLKDTLINNQFAKKIKTEDGKFVLSPLEIKVHIYDENIRLKAIDLNNGIFKYNKASFNHNEYLDLPKDYISNVDFHLNTNIEDRDFINSIYDEIKNRIKENKTRQINFFFISLNSDMYNCLIADAIKKSLSTIENAFNYYFVRNAIGDANLNKAKDVIYMGQVKDIFSYRNVLLNEVYSQAKFEHYLYQGKENEDIEKLWQELPKTKQKSNIYAVLSLNFKAHLLNLSENNYKEKYIKDDNNGIKRLITPSEKFSARDVLAFIEHERWNAFELSCGVLPLKISSFLKINENTKEGEEALNQIEPNYHLCIASSYGLVEYYELFNKYKFGGADVIKWDYTLMDNFIAHKEKAQEAKEA